MIYVTHDQTEALTFADKVVVMHDGAVVQTGTPEELFERPAHTFVGHFIGSPGMNVLPCRGRGRDGRRRRTAGDRARRAPTRRCRRGGRIELGVRPEFVPLRPGAAALPVRVRRIDDLGRARIARVELVGRAAGGERARGPDDRRRRGRRWPSIAARIHVYADGHLVAGEPAAMDKTDQPTRPGSWCCRSSLIVAFSAVCR